MELKTYYSNRDLFPKVRNFTAIPETSVTDDLGRLVGDDEVLVAVKKTGMQNFVSVNHTECNYQVFAGLM